MADDPTDDLSSMVDLRPAELTVDLVLSMMDEIGRRYSVPCPECGAWARGRKRMELGSRAVCDESCGWCGWQERRIADNG